mmetsp:Transcript_9345/g.15097  ORF Transcript_9345/g.15097 Transcript_9345/m.15097 type:complete len:123 (+) Transcript_9345:1786-2154(+)
MISSLRDGIVFLGNPSYSFEDSDARRFLGALRTTAEEFRGALRIYFVWELSRSFNTRKGGLPLCSKLNIIIARTRFSSRTSKYWIGIGACWLAGLESGLWRLFERWQSMVALQCTKAMAMYT